MDSNRLLQLSAKNIADYTNDSIVILDKTGKILFVNKKIETWLGYREEELVGKNIALSGLMPAPSVKIAVKNLALRFLGVDVPPYTVEFITKDKLVLTSTIRAKLIKDENDHIVADLVVITAVSEKRDLEQKLALERQKTDVYIDMVDLIMIIINKDGLISLLNKKGGEILGVNENDAVGLNWFESFVPEDEREETQQIFNTIISGKVDTFSKNENNIITHEGKRRLISWHNTVLKDENGNIYATLSSGEDVTESSKSKQELEEKTKELERINQLMIGRELKMVELKEEIELLKIKSRQNGI